MIHANNAIGSLSSITCIIIVIYRTFVCSYSHSNSFGCRIVWNAVKERELLK